MFPLAKRIEGVEISGIRRMFERARELKDPYDLSLGMAEHDIPDDVKKSVGAFLAAPRSGAYSQNAGDPEVRKLVANKLRARNGIAATADEVLITNGATGGLLLALATLCDPGDEVIIFDPCFVLYRQILAFLGIRPIVVSTYPKWELPFQEMVNLLTPRTKAILFNTPNNPTGKVYGHVETALLAAFARKHGLCIIADEVYEEFVYSGEHMSIGSMYPNTVTVMSPGKFFSLAGWRIGYVHAPQEVIDGMLKVQHVVYVCAPTIAQAALAKSFSIDGGAIRAAHKRKNALVREMLGHVLGMEGAFYAFLGAPGGNATACVERLFRQKVVVVPGNVFSEQNTHFRIAYSLPEERLREALAIIRTVIRG